MKTVVLTSESSGKSTTASSTTTTDNMEPETRDSCYFPGCRKDANCDCDICLASINATLDLKPKSIQRSSLTKFSGSKPFPRSPIFFNPSLLSTPRSSHRGGAAVTPLLKSTARTSFHENSMRKKRHLGFCSVLMRLVMVLSLIFGMEYGFSWIVSGVLIPELSPEIVKNLGEKSCAMKNPIEKMEFLKKELQELVVHKVSNCSYDDSMWKINQDGLLLNSRCKLYESKAEEVSIWGWPLQTAGLLTTEISSKSFTILSGRLTEWSNGEVLYTIREANHSWIRPKWSAAAVQMDPGTWVLEYKQKSMLENARLMSAAVDFLRFRLRREVEKMIKHEFWQLHGGDFTRETVTVPT